MALGLVGPGGPWACPVYRANEGQDPGRFCCAVCLLGGDAGVVTRAGGSSGRVKEAEVVLLNCDDSCGCMASSLCSVCSAELVGDGELLGVGRADASCSRLTFCICRL